MMYNYWGSISPFKAFALLNPAHFSLDFHVFRSVEEFYFENPPPWLSIPILTGPSDITCPHNRCQIKNLQKFD